MNTEYRRWWITKFPHTVVLPATDPAITGMVAVSRWIKANYPELTQIEFFVGQKEDTPVHWGFEFTTHHGTDRVLYVFFKDEEVAENFKSAWSQWTIHTHIC